MRTIGIILAVGLLCLVCYSILRQEQQDLEEFQNWTRDRFTSLVLHVQNIERQVQELGAENDITDQDLKTRLEKLEQAVNDLNNDFIAIL